MRYREGQIKLNPRKIAADEGGIDSEKRISLIESALTRKYGAGISNVEIVRESIDARKKPDVRLVYTVDFDSPKKLKADLARKAKYEPLVPRERKARPVVAGFGPCGIFAALTLAEAGLRPIVIERGRPVDERVEDVNRFWADPSKGPDPESNVQFGEGGAGTFSDGKLTTGIKDIRIRKVLEDLVRAGADDSILYKQKPHIGTDRLRSVVKNLRERIVELGGEILFSRRLEDVQIHEGCVKAAILDGGERIETNCIILAVGHSARDTFTMLQRKGLEMKRKPFSIGVRIEHPQEMIDRSQYGDPSLAGIIGPAEYKLSYRTADRGVYTFCMCPGGVVVNASTEEGTSVTNGMSYFARDGKYANSALLVDVRPSDYSSEGEDDPLAGVAFQERYERLAWENRGGDSCPKMTYGSFRDEGANNPIRNSLPSFATEAIIEAMPNLGRKLKGFDRDDAVMTAVESRSSSPVRIVRDDGMNCIIGGKSVKGLIPAGEGPGYAGGIMSAAVDGIRAAEAVIGIR